MFNIPKITKNLLIINVIVYLATLVMWRGLDLNDVFGLHFFLAPDFHFYQFFTYMFMHAGFMHLFLNMFALWMFGCVVENVWGPKKFLFYYMACGVGAGLFQELAQFVQFHVIAAQQVPGIGMFELLQVAEANAEGLNTWTTVGASGAVYGILLAFGMIFPEQRIFIFPFPFPIKAKWFVIIYAGLEVAQALSTPGDGVAHLAHLGGMAFGYMMIRYWRSHPGTGYGMDGGTQFFDSMRASWERQRNRWTANRRSDTGRQSAGSDPDWEYNARKKAEQEEIDRILDKIRRNGYDSLTKEEKQTLFDSSNRK